MGLPRGADGESPRLAGVGFRMRPWPDLAGNGLVQRLLSTATQRSARVSPTFSRDVSCQLRRDLA